MYANARKYNLTGTDAMVFEALVFLCAKTGECKISSYKLADFSRCGDATTATRTLKRLIDRGLVLQNAAGVLQIAVEMLQNAANPKKENQKENIIHKKINLPSSKEECKGGGLVDFSDSFSEFWAAYKPLPEYDNRKIKCYEQWQKIPESWRVLALQNAENHAVNTNPFFWLREEAFLRVGAKKVCDTPKLSPHWLSGVEQDDCLRAGITLVVCRNPETGKFGTVTKDDADKFKLQILRKM